MFARARNRGLTERQFAVQILRSEAKEAGLFCPAAVMEVYRLDTRAPDAVLKAGGFHPNPTKEHMSLVQHVRSEDGSGSFVSFSIDPEVASLITKGTLFFPEENQLNYTSSQEREHLCQLIKQANPKCIPDELTSIRTNGIHYFSHLCYSVSWDKGVVLPEPVQYESWVYKVRTLVTVTNPTGYLHRAEKEAIGCCAPVQSILAYRRVKVTRAFFVKRESPKAGKKLHLTSKRKPNVEYDGDWRPFNVQDVRKLQIPSI